MSSLLASWLQSEIGLSRRVSAAELDSAFQSGFLFAELLFRLGTIPAIESVGLNDASDRSLRFQNAPSSNLEASIANFILIEKVLRERLNIKLSPNTAFDLIMAKPGCAASLLYQIKSSAGSSVAASVLKGQQRIAGNTFHKLPPIPLKKTEITGPRENASPSPTSYPSSPTGERPKLPNAVEDSHRKKYDNLEHDFFAETLRQKLRRVHRAGFRPLDHPKLEHPEVDYEKLLQKKKLEVGTTKVRDPKKVAKVAEACEPVTKIAPSLQRTITKEMTVTDFIHEQREKKKNAQKQMRAQEKTKLVVQNMIENMDSFEKNLHLASPPEINDNESTQLEQGKTGDTQQVIATSSSLDSERDEIKEFLASRCNMDPVQHVQKLEIFLPPKKDLVQKSVDYVAKIRERKIEEETSRKEREQRRRKIVLGHQLAKEEMENTHLEELLLTKLMRQSKQERRIAEGLTQIRLEKDFMRENRMHREEQYAKRRQKDFEEALEKEFILSEAAREEYKKQTQLQMAQHFEILALKAAEKHAKNTASCKEIVNQIVDFSIKISEYRELNDFDDSPPNPNVMRQWKILFIKGQPLLKTYTIPLETDHVGQVIDNQTTEITVGQAEEKETTEDVLEGITLIDEEEFKHYLDGTGVWGFTSTHIKNGPIKNEFLGQFVQTIFDLVAPANAQSGNFKMPSVPLKIVILGKRFAGKATLANYLAARYELSLLQVDALVKEAIREAQALEADCPDHKQKKAISASHIGSKLQNVLHSGLNPDDDLLVTLVAESIRKHTSESRGWILVDFPRNRNQAQLLEKELTGYEDPKPVKPGSLKRTPTKAEKEKASAQASKKKSLIAQADEKAEGKTPSAPSGIDIVLLLDVDNETAIKRSKGRRIDPVTGTEYHLESHPPPLDKPGIYERLVLVEDPGSQDAQLHYQLAMFEEQEDSLKEWFIRFNNLYVVEAAVSSDSIRDDVQKTVEEVVAKKESDKSSKERELAAAESPPSTKPNISSVPTSAAIEEPGRDLIPTSEVKAEDKKKTSSGKQRVESGKTNNADKVASRGTSALQKPAESSNKRMIGIPDKSGSTVIYVETPDVSLPPLVREVTADGRKLPSKELAEILSDQWVTLEQTYTNTIKFAFRCLRRERDIIMRYRHKTKIDFRKFLERPDKKQDLLDLFQKEYNIIEDDLRQDADAKAELHQRAEDLREKLWDLSDKRRDEADSERTSIIDDRYIEDHFAIMTNIYITMMQAEVDRYLFTRQIVQDYYKDAYGSTVLSEAPKGHLKLPLISPTVIPPVDTSAVVEALHKRKDFNAQATGVAKPKAVLAIGAAKKVVESSVSRIKFSGIGETNGIPDPDPSMFADLDSAMSVALTAIVKEKPVHHEDAPVPEKEKKDKKKAAAVEVVPEQKVETENEMPPEFQNLVDLEDKILQTRLEKIKLVAILGLTEVRNIGIELYAHLDEIIGQRFNAEMDSIREILQLIKEAIEAESKLPNELVLVGDRFKVNFGCLTYEPEPDPRPESPVEKPKADIPGSEQFTVLQLLNLGKHFKSLAPGGFLKTKEFVENIQRLGNLSPGADVLPEGYVTSDFSFLQQVAISLDPYDTGFVNWRRFILTNTRVLPIPSVDQLANIKALYMGSPSYADGTISFVDYMNVPLWFEDDGDDYILQTEENSSIPKFNRPAKLKQALFELFSSTKEQEKQALVNMNEQIQPIRSDLEQIPMEAELVPETKLEAETEISATAEPGANQPDEAAENKQPEPLFDVYVFLMGCVLDDSAKAGLQKAFCVLSDRVDGAVNLQQLYQIFHFPLLLVDETNRLANDQVDDPIPMDMLAKIFEDAGLAQTDFISFEQLCAVLDGQGLLNCPLFVLEDNYLTMIRVRSPLLSTTK